MDGIGALYLFVLAGVAGYVMIARVPSMLHLPLLSGANFVHGVVLCGAMLALAQADGNLQRTVGSVAVALAAANVVGGYLVTDRLLTLFERRAARSSGRGERRGKAARKGTTTGTAAPASDETPSTGTASRADAKGDGA